MNVCNLYTQHCRSESRPEHYITLFVALLSACTKCQLNSSFNPQALPSTLFPASHSPVILLLIVRNIDSVGKRINKYRKTNSLTDCVTASIERRKSPSSSCKHNEPGHPLHRHSSSTFPLSRCWSVEAASLVDLIPVIVGWRAFSLPPFTRDRKCMLRATATPSRMCEKPPIFLMQNCSLND